MRRHKVWTPPVSARLAIIESQERHGATSWITERFIAWTVLLAGMVPWVLLGNGVAAWSAMLLAGCFVSIRLGGPMLEMLVPLLTAVCVYGGAAATAPRPWAFGLALVTLGLASLLERPRRVRLAAMLLIAVSLLLVLHVLNRPQWLGFSQRFVSLCTGLALGAAVFAAARQLLRPTHPRAHWALAVLAAAGLVATARQAFWPPHNDTAWTLPAWRTPLLYLATAPEEATAATDATLGALDVLRRVGARDAGEAWVALALGQNALPATLRDSCPRLGWSGALPAAWASWVEQGKQVCQALQSWPEDAAATLEGSTVPALQRLRGDILMEAGRVDAATAAYARATQLGDVYAEAAQRLGRLERHRPVQDPTQPVARILAQQTLFDRANWQSLNALWRFTTLAAPERAGVRVSSPDALRSIYDASLGHRVLLSNVEHGSVTAEVMLPEGAVSVRALGLRLKRRGALILSLNGRDGVVVRRVCDGSWLVDACSGEWADLRLPVAELVPGGLRSLTLEGAFALASIAGET